MLLSHFHFQDEDEDLLWLVRWSASAYEQLRRWEVIPCPLEASSHMICGADSLWSGANHWLSWFLFRCWFWVEDFSHVFFTLNGRRSPFCRVYSNNQFLAVWSGPGAPIFSSRCSELSLHIVFRRCLPVPLISTWSTLDTPNLPSSFAQGVRRLMPLFPCCSRFPHHPPCFTKAWLI